MLVHGGFVDRSGWEAVYRALRKKGFTVGIVQDPAISLADDAQATRRVVAALIATASKGAPAMVHAGQVALTMTWFRLPAS